jgi:hypothetical protein
VSQTRFTCAKHAARNTPKQRLHAANTNLFPGTKHPRLCATVTALAHTVFFAVLHLKTRVHACV